MDLSLISLVVVAATMALVIGAVYAGGGTEALQAQRWRVATLAAALIAITAAILVVSRSDAVLLAVGVAVAAASAFVAGYQAWVLHVRKGTRGIVAVLLVAASILAMVAVVGLVAFLR